MSALAIFALAQLVHDAAGRAPNDRRLPLGHRLVRYSAACIVMGSSALFHAIAAAAAAASGADPIPEASGILALALVGFLLWAGGVALLLLAFTAERFPVAARRAAQVVEALVASVF